MRTAFLLTLTKAIKINSLGRKEFAGLIRACENLSITMGKNAGFRLFGE